MRLLSLGLAAFLLAAAACRASAQEAAQALGPVETFTVGSAVARLWLPPEAPDQRASGAAVVVVGDIAAPDARADPYMERLNAAGFATLELVASDDGGVSGLGRNEIRVALVGAVAALAADRRFTPGRVGLLGFGSGARAAFTTALNPDAGGIHWSAVALLYPGCGALLGDMRDASPTATPAPFLLLHGDSDPANPAAVCAALSEALEQHAPVERVEYRGAGYAWDRSRYGDPAPELLPAPGGVGRVRSTPWPALAEVSAEQVARFFSLTLAGPR